MTPYFRLCEFHENQIKFRQIKIQKKFDAIRTQIKISKKKKKKKRPKLNLGDFQTAESRRAWFDQFAIQKGIQFQEDWYKVGLKDYQTHGGWSLLKFYSSSPYICVKTVYPGEEQYLSKILNQTRIHMVSMDVCTHFALVLEEQGHSSTLLRLDCRTQRHRKWYSLSIPELTSEWKNVALLSKPFYGRNLSHVLPKVYPEFVWHPWLFAVNLRGYWNDFKRHKKFFDWMEEELDIRHKDEWYNYSYKDVIERGGCTLINQYYNMSLYSALKTVYPEHNWVAWNFNRVSKKFWSDSDNVNSFVKNLTSKLNIQKMEDWYNVSVEQMHEHGAAGLISRLSLYQLLVRLYPEYPWDHSRFYVRKKIATRLQNILCELFSGRITTPT